MLKPLIQSHTHTRHRRQPLSAIDMPAAIPVASTRPSPAIGIEVPTLAPLDRRQIRLRRD